MQKILMYCFVFLVFQAVAAQEKTFIKSAEVTFNFVNNDVDGSFSGFDSTSKIDLQNLEKSVFQGSVAVETIKTGNFLRDWSLKGGKYFDADEYPRITFESSEVTTTTNGFKVTGSITIKGVTETITFDFKKQGKELVGTTTLFSSDFGIDVKKRREQNKVNVKLKFELQ